MDTLKTGDLLLFTPKKYNTWLDYISSFIKYPKETYEHIGMIIKDPIFIDSSLKGLYLWTIGYENIIVNKNKHPNKNIHEIQIIPLHEIINKNIDYKLIIRRVKCNYMLFNNFKLNEINKIVKEDIYEYINYTNLDYIKDTKIADYIKDTNMYKTTCSILIGYIYTKCGILKQDTNWNTFIPNDFSLNNRYLKFEENCSLDNKTYEVYNYDLL